MPQDKPITAILVTYNSEKVIGQAVPPLLSDSAVSEVVIVDNHSTDNTCSLVRRNFPQAQLIENDKNKGFGCGNNMALENVQTSYALLINPDAVLMSGTSRKLLDAAERYSDAAMLAPALYDAEGNLHHSFKRNVFDREAARSPRISAEGDCCADFLSGAVLLLNMRLMKEVGFFDPNIFLYYEDDDLCLRVRAAGYGLVFVPDAHAVHLMGASSGESDPKSEFFKQKHLARSRLYIEEKYRGREAAQKLASKQHLQYAIKAAGYLLCFNRRQVARYRGRIAGIFEYLQ